MGSLFGSGKTTQNSNQSSSSSSASSTSPWSPQQPYITNLFSQAQQNLNNQEATGPYSGSYSATENPYQSTGYSYAAGNAPNAYSRGNTLVDTGASLAADAGHNAYSNAGGLFGTASVGPTSSLSTALNQAALNGTSALSTSQGTLGSVQSMGTADQTQRLAGDAQAYMASAPVQQSVNATNAAIGQTLNESTVPGLNRVAASEGNLNSSRAGAAEAMAQGQAATAEGSADAGIYNNAYNEGLGTALSSYGTGLGAATSAASTSGNLGNSSALGTASNQLAAAQDSYGNQLGANQQLLSTAQLGNQTASTGSGLYGTGASLYGQAGTGQQAADQAGITNQYDNWQMNNNFRTNALQGYQGLISGSYGGQSTGQNSGQSSGTTVDQGPTNVLGGLLGLGTTGAALFGQGGALSGLFGDSSDLPSVASAASSFGSPGGPAGLYESMGGGGWNQAF